MNTTNTSKLESIYSAVGLRCQIEAGPVGLVIYAASADIAGTVARSIAKAPKKLGAAVKTTRPVADLEEPAESRFWARVEFDLESLADLG